MIFDRIVRSATLVRHYIGGLTAGKIALWCYLIWYLSTVFHYFDSSPGVWFNSLGISCVVGIALTLSVKHVDGAPHDRWQTFRLFFMPFAVSSFSALIKGHGFVLVFPPSIAETAVNAGLCAIFVLIVTLTKRRALNVHP